MMEEWPASGKAKDHAAGTGGRCEPRSLDLCREAYLEQLRNAALIAEAEGLATGVRHLAVVTGELESADDVARLEELSAAARRGRDGARTTSTRGGNDYLVFYVEGSAADQFVDELVALAESLNPGWWRIMCSSQPF